MTLSEDYVKHNEELQQKFLKIKEEIEKQPLDLQSFK